MSTLEESTPSLTSRSGSGRELWVGKEEMGEGSDERVWQGRCIELEDSLARFRDQAHRIREILKEKVRHYITLTLQKLKLFCYIKLLLRINEFCQVWKEILNFNSPLSE